MATGHRPLTIAADPLLEVKGDVVDIAAALCDRYLLPVGAHIHKHGGTEEARRFLESVVALLMVSGGRELGYAPADLASKAAGLAGHINRTAGMH